MNLGLASGARIMASAAFLGAAWIGVVLAGAAVSRCLDLEASKRNFCIFQTIWSRHACMRCRQSYMQPPQWRPDPGGVVCDSVSKLLGSSCRVTSQFGRSSLIFQVVLIQVRRHLQLSLARAPGVAFTVFSCVFAAAAVGIASLLRGSADPGTAGAGVAVQVSPGAVFVLPHVC